VFFFLFEHFWGSPFKYTLFIKINVGVALYNFLFKFLYLLITQTGLAEMNLRAVIPKFLAVFWAV
jgi:hypothetical protein